MELQLSAAESELLLHILEQHLHELVREIAHTDNREFRALLRAREELLEGLRQRLEAGAAATA